MSGQTEASPGPVVHLICGSTGAGKSTYAKMLKNEIGAIHLAVDDWMTSLFAPDLEDPMDWPWISERALRCEQKIVATACELALTGASSVLEIGFQRASRRAEVASIVAEAGCVLQTHFLDVDVSERWRRVQKRNVDKGETFTLEISREVFDFFETMWESPSTSEPIFLTKVEARSTQ